MYLDRFARKACQKLKSTNTPKKQQKDKPIPSTYVWRAPEIFDLLGETPRHIYLTRLDRLRENIRNGVRNICLDFEQTEKLFSDGTLLFIAEIRRLLRHYEGEIAITAKLSQNNKVNQVLKQIGLLDLLGINTPIIPQDDDVINWRHAHGEQVEGGKYEDILQDYDGEIAYDLQKGLFAGITEAMTNVVKHAYIFDRDDGLSVKSRGWWMFSQQKDGMLSVVICDLGAGISRTLPHGDESWKARIARSLRRRPDDVTSIVYAIQKNVSRTEEEYRGKGLSQIVNVIGGVDNGEMFIHSNRGTYMYKQGFPISRKNHRTSIFGTLICWRIPLQSL